MKIIVHIFCFFSLTGTGIVKAEHLVENLTVVELFTSQGCNACPPADKILKNIARDESILTLSYAVDYWDYLGWKDTLSNPQNTKRQKHYNTSLGKNSVYTPQMIIHGRKAIVGSHAEEIQDIIAWTKKLAPQGPALNLTTLGDMISLTIGKGHSVKSATVWMVCYDVEKIIHIKGGELKGRIKSYHNVVRSLKRIGSWMGQEINLTMKKRDLSEESCTSYAVIVQQDEVGPILSAARLEGDFKTPQSPK